jgi:DNA-binding MarR family transcriptional regulator
MTASIGATLRRYDLTRAGSLLMTTLLLSREGTRPPGQLSKHLMVHPATITLALGQLEKRGLLHRRPHPTDRRTVPAMLTPAGRELLHQASRALTGTGFGLAGVDRDLANRVIDVLREARGEIGDIPAG